MKKLLFILALVIGIIALVLIFSIEPVKHEKILIAKELPTGYTCVCTTCGKKYYCEPDYLVFRCSYDGGQCICTKNLPIKLYTDN